MKFIYVDESGGRDQGDVFTMCGLMVDAYKLRKKTEEFDDMLNALFLGLPVQQPPRELKTKKFLEGGGAWKQIAADERKEFLSSLCQLAVDNGGKVFGIALSFAAFDRAMGLSLQQPTEGNLWLAAAMYTCYLVQKRMQGTKGRKGLTIFIMDDNKREMPKLSHALYHRSPCTTACMHNKGRCAASKPGKPAVLTTVSTRSSIRPSWSSRITRRWCRSPMQSRMYTAGIWNSPASQRNGLEKGTTLPTSSLVSTRRAQNLVVAPKGLVMTATRPCRIQDGRSDYLIVRESVTGWMGTPTTWASFE